MCFSSAEVSVYFLLILMNGTLGSFLKGGGFRWLYCGPFCGVGDTPVLDVCCGFESPVEYPYLIACYVACRLWFGEFRIDITLLCFKRH